MFWSFFAIARKVLVSRSQRDSVGCYTPASADRACALTARGPSIRRTIRALNVSVYNILGPSFLRPPSWVDRGWRVSLSSGRQLPCHRGIRRNTTT